MYITFEVNLKKLPQILIGDSNSKKIGWLINTSLDLLHSHLISFSKREICRFGLYLNLNNFYDLAANNLFKISSISGSLFIF